MNELTVINHLSEIPEFKTEQDEAEFWDTHTLADHLYTQKAQAEAEALLPLPPNPHKQ